MAAKKHDVYCGNCGIKHTMLSVNGVGYLTCDCGVLMRYSKWKNEKAQLCTYIKENHEETRIPSVVPNVCKKKASTEQHASVGKA